MTRVTIEASEFQFECNDATLLDRLTKFPTPPKGPSRSGTLRRREFGVPIKSVPVVKVVGNVVTITAKVDTKRPIRPGLPYDPPPSPHPVGILPPWP